ncbi:MAG: hypothetical protein M3P48_00855 [Actinomycetota bacterium]|nr:hypothetical protein [Actinomycetota bacterium]
MSYFVQVFRAKIDPANVQRLRQIRPRAIAEAQRACPALVRAELVRLDEETWLDVLTWSAPDGDQQLMARAHGLAALGEMHGLVRDVVAVDKGELLTSTAL